MNDVTVSPRGHRFGFLIAIALLAVGAFVALQTRAEMDANFKGWATSAVVLLSLILTLFWFMVLSRYTLRLRFAVLALLVALVFGIKATTRIDGAINGSGLPNVVWKWTPKREVTAAPVRTQELTALPLHADIPDVPQFFGPARDGVIHNAHLDNDWAAHPPKQLWKQPVGLGWAAFAVAGGRAFTLEQRGEDELVTCYDVVTGALVWSHGHSKVRFVEWQGGDGPRSTPTIDNGRVYALGATGILDCLNAKDGSQVWTRNVLADDQLPNLMWGKSISPLVFDDKVVVTGGDKKGPCLFAYQRDTGAPLWKTGDDQSSYASPTLVTLEGKRVILSSNGNTLTAHDPATGKVLLNHPWGLPKWPRAAQPTLVPGDRLFLSAGYGMGCLMLQIKAGADDQLTATELWSSHKMKTQFNSVHIHNGYLYGLDDGALACMNLETGERLWKDGRFGAGQSLLVDDTILVQSERGDVVLVAAKPDGYHELGRVTALSSKTWNHPVLAGRYLLVRNDQEMMCFELPLVK